MQAGFDAAGVDVAKLTNEEIDKQIPLPPASLRAYVQGNPGTGKTFVAVTPTGCSADLIHGETVYRAAKVPAGNKKQNGPITSDLSG